MAVYDNVITQNWILNNGLSGVTLHAHAPNQDLNGNQITDNVLGTNNLHGDPDAGVTDTTGVLVYSGVVGVNTTISGNTVVADAIGISGRLQRDPERQPHDGQPLQPRDDAGRRRTLTERLSPTGSRLARAVQPVRLRDEPSPRPALRGREPAASPSRARCWCGPARPGPSRRPTRGSG